MSNLIQECGRAYFSLLAVASSRTWTKYYPDSAALGDIHAHTLSVFLLVLAHKRQRHKLMNIILTSPTGRTFSLEFMSQYFASKNLLIHIKHVIGF